MLKLVVNNTKVETFVIHYGSKSKNYISTWEIEAHDIIHAEKLFYGTFLPSIFQIVKIAKKQYDERG